LTKLTDTSSRYIVGIEGPTVLANAISFVTVGLAESMLAAGYLLAWCFRIIITYDLYYA